MYHFRESSDCLVSGHATQTGLTGVSPQFSSKGNVRVFSFSLWSEIEKNTLSLKEAVHRLIEWSWHVEEEKTQKKKCAADSSVLVFIPYPSRSLEIGNKNLLSLTLFDIEYLSFDYT